MILDKVHKIIFYVITFIGLCFSCAVPRAPEGGPRDQTPPKITQSTPANFSTNYTQRHIAIHFDEYIELKDLSSQLLVSPAPKEAPEINVKGKTLHIDFTEELLPNTTYNVYLGNAVADYTEGNTFKDFNFCFSTGNYIDSMQIKGTVKNALTLQPEKNISVMLYTENIDSLPSTALPYYITKTNDAGEFHFRNIQNIPYKITAVNDANANQKYDADEYFAFIDSMIYPVYIPPATNDSTVKDSVQKPDFTSNPVELLLFKEAKIQQAVLNSGFSENGVLNISYQIPEKLSVKVLKSTPENIDYTLFYVDSLNALTCFFKDKNVTFAELWVSGKNDFSDTVKVEFFKKVKDVEPWFTVQSNIQSQQDFFKMPELLFSYPITDFEARKIKLLKIQDSSTVAVKYTWNDSIHKHLILNSTLEEGMTYQLLIDSLCFKDMYGRKNQIFSQTFSTTTQKEYGELSLKMELPDNQNYLLQLIEDGKSTIAQEININQSKTVHFIHIQPATYIVRVIYDENNNRQWDTGKYSEKKQAEKVKLFSKKITLKANWTVEESWKLEK